MEAHFQLHNPVHFRRVRSGQYCLDVAERLDQFPDLGRALLSDLRQRSSTPPEGTVELALRLEDSAYARTVLARIHEITLDNQALEHLADALATARDLEALAHDA